MMDHEAIVRAYPNVVVSDSDTGQFDASGNQVTIEQSQVDAARTAIDTENAAVLYKKKRTDPLVSDTNYPTIGDQLDNLYKDILAGKLDATGEFAKAIKSVKDAHPKP